MAVKQCFAVTLLLLLSLAGFIYYNSIPTYNGTITVARDGLNTITITRDAFGIPTIESETLADVSYGIGYAHAQDRLWSIEFKRKVGQGRLSEFAGRETLRTDILFRELRIEQNSMAKYNNLDEYTKSILISYANGINDYVAQLSMLPLEFQILGVAFEPWQPHQSLSLLNLMTFFLSLEVVYEPFRHLLMEKYGEDLAMQMMGSREEFNFEMTTVMDEDDLKKMGLYSPRNSTNANHSSTPRVDEDLLTGIVTDDIASMLENVVKGIQGSNSWVVHGNHTASGKPLLANDPHLETLIPSIWYQAELVWKQDDGEKHQVIGATLPGLPYMMIGRSNYFSWGITNNIIDIADYYIETIIDNKYLHNSTWIEMNKTEEVIKVRFEEPFVFTVLETHHGTLIQGLFHLMDPKNYQAMNHKVSLKWAGHYEQDTNALGLQKVMTAKCLSDVEEAFSIISTPALNLIFATTDNHIGYYAQGKLPIKNFPEHVFFRNGSDPSHDWTGYVSKEDQPRVIDPAKGFIVTANNKIAPDSLVNQISISQSSIPRARRITDLLEEGIKAGKKFTPKDFMLMQKDVHDVYAQRVVPNVLKIYKRSAAVYLTSLEIEKLQKFVEILEQWDYKMAKESIGASVYIAWEHYFLQSFLHEVGPQETRIIMNMSYMFDQFMMHEVQRMGNLEGTAAKYLRSYCKIDKTNEEGDCVKNLILSFIDAFTKLTTEHGENMSAESWQWGAVHKHRFDHKPFSQTPLRKIFERSYVGEGNRRTINVGGVNHLPNNWESWYSPNYRQVTDLSENNESYYVLDTGISESIFSPHYDD